VQSRISNEVGKKVTGCGSYSHNFGDWARSSMSHEYGISSQEEAAAYLAHPVLGRRLIKCTEIVNGLEDPTIEQIFGDIDSKKFRSCMTLFAKVAPHDEVFVNALRKYFGGVPDQVTLDRI
jgi:uncharacterized protein (DUF1810 family)